MTGASVAEFFVIGQHLRAGTLRERCAEGLPSPERATEVGAAQVHAHREALS